MAPTYTARDAALVHAELVAKLQELQPGWSPELAAEVGNVFVELFAHLADGLHYAINWAARQPFIGWAEDPAAVEQIARLLGYEIPEATEASVDLTFSLTSARSVDVVLPVGLRVATRSGLDFEVSEERTIPAGATELEDVPARQVRTRSESFEGTGLADQQLTLSFRPWLKGSVAVRVDGQAWTEVETRIADPEHDTGPEAQIFTVSRDLRGRAVLRFGDSTNGAPPAEGAAIVVTYEQGGGTAGRVAAETITELRSSVVDDNGDLVTDLACTNPGPATGGTDREALSVTRLRIPRHARTTDSTVGLDDWISHIEEVDGIARATVRTRALSGDDALQPSTVYVHALPEGGGGLTVEQKSAIIEAVTETHPHTITVDVLVLDVGAGGSIDLEAELEVFSGYELADVQAAVEAHLQDLFDPKAVLGGEYVWAFGQTVYRSWLISQFHAVPGVRSVALSEPAADVELGATDFPTLGAITWA